MNNRTWTRKPAARQAYKNQQSPPSRRIPLHLLSQLKRAQGPKVPPVCVPPECDATHRLPRPDLADYSQIIRTAPQHLLPCWPYFETTRSGVPRESLLITKSTATGRRRRTAVLKPSREHLHPRLSRVHGTSRTRGKLAVTVPAWNTLLRDGNASSR